MEISLDSIRRVHGADANVHEVDFTITHDHGEPTKLTIRVDEAQSYSHVALQADAKLSEWANALAVKATARCATA